MTKQELRDKIVISTVWKDCYGDEVIIDRAVAEQIADALIAAGLKFDVNYSFTAAFNDAQVEREHDLERNLTLTERRANIAEKSFDLVYEEASRYMRLSTKEWYRKMAKNIMEENDD